MFRRYIFTAGILFLASVCGGCSKRENRPEEEKNVVTGHSGDTFVSSDDIIRLFLSQTGRTEEEWVVSMTKETESITAALLVSGAVPQPAGEYCVRSDHSMRAEQYLVFIRRADKTLIGQPIRERGVSQLCFYGEGAKLYAGIIYESSFAGWEDYSMKWLCCEEDAIYRVFNASEAENPYLYWKDRKAEFSGDGTVCVFLRDSREGAFETLLQNRELAARDSYTDFVPEYGWTDQQQISVSEWLEKSTPEGAGILPGPELISMLYDLDETGALSEPLYFYAGYEGAAAEIYLSPKPAGEKQESRPVEGVPASSDEAYFIIKKCGMDAGALYIGSLDISSGQITQCLTYPGACSQAAAMVSDGVPYFLFCTETVSNGMPTALGGILKGENGVLSMVWPQADSKSTWESYWHPCGEAAPAGTVPDGETGRAGADIRGSRTSGSGAGEPVHRTARLKGDKLQIFRIHFIYDADSLMPVDYETEFEGEAGPGMLQK